MVSSIARSTASGSTANFSVPFPYLDKTHVQVRLNGTLLPTSGYTWPNAGEIQLVAGNPPVGTVVERRRLTPDGPLAVFQPGNLDSDDLNVGVAQPLYKAQEGTDQAADILARAWFTQNYGLGGTVEVGPAGSLLMWDALGNVVVGPSASEILGYREAALSAAGVATAQAGIAVAGGQTSTAQAAIATTKASEATASATLAQKWAANPEDIEVSGGLFSAFHWYRKTLALATTVLNGMAGWIHGATIKATPTGADELGIADSAAAWSLKRVTLTQLKAMLFSGNAAFTGTTANSPTVDLETTVVTGSGTVIGVLQFLGRSATGVQRAFAKVFAYVSSDVNGAERGRLYVSTLQAGVSQQELYIDGGIAGNGAVGGTKGVGTANLKALYVDNVAVPTVNDTIGLGQTWQDVLASRTFNVTYQNTTGKPIQVMLRAVSNDTSVKPLQASVDGTNWVAISNINGSATGHGVMSFIVPNGHYYRIASGVISLSAWSELR